MTPDLFRDAFEASTREQEATLLDCWSSPSKFTKYVKGELMPRVAEHLMCDMETEYRRIDIVLTRTPEKTVVVAVEHENNFSGSAVSEIIKLKNLDCSLGVLITYISQRQRQRMIKEYNEAMSSNSKNNQSSAPNCSSILIIIGPYGLTPPKNLAWEYYAYDGQEFNIMDVR